MKFSLNWLRRYIDLKERVTIPDMLDRLTLTGTEVEGSHTLGTNDPNIVIGHILSSQPHPNADRLRVCRVNDGKGERSIVCGARNYKDGDKVPLALPGAVLPGGMVIQETKMRGELSQGMLCSAKELALAEDAEGLLLLPADAPVGARFGEYMTGDTLFEVEITSNRPDLLSYRGLVRELAAAEAGILKPLDWTAPSYPEASSAFTVDLQDTELCPYYSLVHLTGVKVGPSPDWLQEAIRATGHKPINNVVDITNFVLFETGQPLHAFSADKIDGKRIVVRRAQAEESLLALDDQTYKLKPENLVIADEAAALAIAGVMGGKPSGVDAATTEIVLEAAWFLPATVRRTSKQLGLSSDSSYRYERRVDPHTLIAARDRAVQLLQEIASAQIVATPVVAGKPPEPRGFILLRHERVNQLLGMDIPASTITAQLSSLGCVLLNRPSDLTSQWQPPTWRDDLAREVDLIEEIARLTGMEQIPSRLRASGQPESTTDFQSHRINLLRRFLANQGWDECVTDPLQSKEAAEVQAPAGITPLQLVNPLNELYTHLRPALRSSLLKVAANSLAKGTPGCCLFELGKVYLPQGEITTEPIHLGLLVTGLIQPAAWHQPERHADLYDLTGVLQALEKSAGLSFSKALVSGELTPVPSPIAARFGLKVPAYFAELDLTDWLTNHQPQPARYEPLANFPAVRRDVAVLVPLSTPQAVVEAVIRKAAPATLESVTLFDLFRDEKGEKIPVDQKSLAYAFTFRSPAKTLTEKEVNKAFDDLKAALVKELGCSFRDGK